MEGCPMYRFSIAALLLVVFLLETRSLDANDYLVGGQFNTPRVTHYRYRQTGQITYYGPRCCPPANECRTACYPPATGTPVTSSTYQPVAGGRGYNIRSNYTPYQLGQTVQRPARQPIPVAAAGIPAPLVTAPSLPANCPTCPPVPALP